MNEFIGHLIASIRHQMHALDQSLEMLEKQIRTVEDDSSLRCPACDTELSSENEYTAMGMSKKHYACPNCEFRGPI